MDGHEWKLTIQPRRKGYNPDQPRVPAGQSGGGRWASGSAPTTEIDRSSVSFETNETTPVGSRQFSDLADDERLQPRNFVPETERAIFGYAKRILTASDPESAEMNFSIFQSTSSGELRRTPIVPGRRGVVQEIHAPNGWRTVGSFHTHPGSSGQEQRPSTGDRRSAAYINIDTGAGVFAIGSWRGGRPEVTYWSTDYPRRRIEGPGQTERF